jgi:hypothetical protein
VLNLEWLLHDRAAAPGLVQSARTIAGREHERDAALGERPVAIMDSGFVTSARAGMNTFARA